MRQEKMDVYLDMAFAGTTGEHQIKIYPNVKEIFWSVSKPWGLGLLRAGIRFTRKAEPIQEELQGVGYFNHAMIDVFNLVSYFLVGIHKTYHATHKIKKTGNIDGVLNQKTLSIEEGATLKIKAETHK